MATLSTRYWTHLQLVSFGFYKRFTLGESLASQITSPFNKKIGCFERNLLNFILKITQLIVEWGNYLYLNYSFS